MAIWWMPTCGRLPGSSGTSRGHLSRLSWGSKIRPTRCLAEMPGSGGFSSGAAYRNRTDDLRITRSPPNRSGLATCTDSTTCAPECSQGTGCSGLPVHNPVHGVDRPSVTECHWMPDSTRAKSSNDQATQPSYRSVQSTRARADQDVRSACRIGGEVSPATVMGSGPRQAGVPFIWAPRS